MVFQVWIIFHALFLYFILYLNESLPSGFSQVIMTLWSLEVINGMKKDSIVTFFTFMH